MKLFRCQHCAQLLYFDNRQCLKCGHRLGYVPEEAALLAVEEKDGGWAVLGRGEVRQFCANAAQDACNWLVAPGEEFCLACRHNRTIPDLSQEINVERWRKVERAKHHLFYTLLALALPLSTRSEDPEKGLAFDFLLDDGAQPAPVMTGHNEGVITLNLIEADDAEREKRRIAMGEPYRTLLGHFRHEVGHYFWDRLVADGGPLDSFRELFGDERTDYQAALKRHYDEGPAPAWQESFVSAYATAHPWEDFAETWAHYLHIVDTLEMVRAFGLHVEPGGEEDLGVEPDDLRHLVSIDQLIEAWLPVTLTVNSLNRCMGQPDFYPFVLTPAVIAKLGFVHELIRAAAKPAGRMSPGRMSQ